MEIIYRKLKAGEARLFRNIRLESLKNFPNAFGASYEDESKLTKLRFEMFIEQQLTGKFMMGAFAEDELVGICGFIKEEQLRSSHRGIIIQMYVKAKYKRNKIGHNLLQTIITEIFAIPGFELITLGVISDNIAANKIYEGLGFKQYGFLKNYYKDGEHYIDHRFMALYKNGLINGLPT